MKFHQNNDLPFPLLVDENKELIKSFGVWGKKEIYGQGIRWNSQNDIYS